MRVKLDLSQTQQPLPCVEPHPCLVWSPTQQPLPRVEPLPCTEPLPYMEPLPCMEPHPLPRVEPYPCRVWSPTPASCGNPITTPAVYGTPPTPPLDRPRQIISPPALFFQSSRAPTSLYKPRLAYPCYRPTAPALMGPAQPSRCPYDRCTNRLVAGQLVTP